MTCYLENLKWIIGSQETSNSSSKSPDKFEIIERHGGDNEIELDYDFGPSNDDNSISKTQSNIQEIISQYNTIHLEMIKKEQLVRDRLDSDTFDKIKSNYTDYINDDIKIIKDFAIIMESFSQIQKKLSEFESGIRTITSNQDSNNVELENKIQQIDIKLNNTIKFMEEIKLNNDVMMKKIIKLENTINSNDIKGQEILSILENISIVNNGDKFYNDKIGWYKQKEYFRIPLYNDFSNILIYVLTSSCVIGTYFSIKYIFKKN
jgi:hypothetical protein